MAAMSFAGSRRSPQSYLILWSFSYLFLHHQLVLLVSLLHMGLMAILAPACQSICFGAGFSKTTGWFHLMASRAFGFHVAVFPTLKPVKPVYFPVNSVSGSFRRCQLAET
jgi:hypothetical protein